MTKSCRPLLAIPASFLCTLLHAQNIGINTTGAAPAASAMLDISATNRGLLIPRVALTATNAAGPVTAPANALLVYNTATAGAAPNNVTPGYYYWESTPGRWQPLLSAVKGWTTTGNAGTVGGTNFIGTLDAQPFVVKTGGSAATNERMRVLATGPVVVNKTAPAAGDVFSVYANGTGNVSAVGDYSINGYTSAGYGIYGEASNAAGMGVVSTNTATTGATTALWSEAASRNGTGIVGIANSSNAQIPNGTNAIGIQGQVNGTLAPSGQAIGVLGITPSTMTTGDASGVWGQSASSLGTGVYGIATSAATGTVQPVGTYGRATNPKGFGVYGRNNHLTGTGISASGNNELGMYLVDGSGLTATGTETGAFHYYTSPGAGQGTLIQDAYGGQWNVGYYDGFSYYKIVGNGLVSTIVKDLEEQPVLLYCPESPEVLFQDYGTGQLSNGSAHIDLDPVLTKNIIVSDEHPMKVFVQVEGDCNGVYVTNKSATGFDVKELGAGVSNVPFSWSITATRGDETLQNANGNVRHASYRQRFGPAPPHMESRKMLDDQPSRDRTQHSLILPKREH